MSVSIIKTNLVLIHDLSIPIALKYELVIVASLFKDKWIQQWYHHIVSAFFVIEFRARQGTGTGILF